MISWLPLAILVGCILLGLALGVPVAFTLGGAAVIVALLFLGPGGLAFVAINTFGAMNTLILIAMPLFIFMASLLQESGVADGLYDSISQWLAPLRGGLSIGTVLICTVIAAMSGVTTTGVVTMGLIALPPILKRGYNKSIILGPIMAGGALGILIPPSVSFILFGMFAKLSIGRLFAGGIIPGFILSFFYCSYIGIRCHFQPHLAPIVPPEERVSLRKKIALSNGLVLPILLILGVLGAIFAGIASPTEAAAVGAAGAIVCAVINRQFSWLALKAAAYRALVVNGMIMWIIFGAFCFVCVFVKTGGAELIQGWILGLEVKPAFVVIVMMLSYCIMGCFLGEVEQMIITIPVYLPILVNLGYDPVWFGVLFLINMQMAYLTPPFGMCLFYMKGVVPPEITVTDLYRSIIPFISIQMLCLALVMYFPQLALYLPNVIFGLK